MLQTIREILDDRMYLLSNSFILDNARKNLSSEKDAESTAWNIYISREKPLRFVKSENTRGAQLIPELSCDIIGGNDTTRSISSSNIEIKLKSDEYNLIFRKDWDSSTIEKKLAKLKERVMVRCHFDYGEKSEDGEPIYHLNFGGISHNDELCWIPDAIRNPRIPFIPIDLVLAIELIVANFYPKKYPILCNDRDWRSLVYTSEKVFLSPVLEKCSNRCKTPITRRITTKDDTIFSSMWLIDAQN
jgi:hypothetical protein